MKLKIVESTDRHKRVRDAVLATLKREGGYMPAEELLAVMAYTCGQLIALQDQRKMTAQMALDLVYRNMERGNQAAFAEAVSAGGTKQ